jgi:DNA invertase Pin-like site-specific DNA recombinase
MLQMIGAFAEFERSLIRQRTGEGMARAKAEGRAGGRPSKLTPQQRAHAVEQLKAGKSQAGWRDCCTSTARPCAGWRKNCW